MTAKRPLEPDDLYRLLGVSDAQISPDGALVAYTVSGLGREQDREHSRIWLVPVDGGQARPLTVAR